MECLHLQINQKLSYYVSNNDHIDAKYLFLKRLKKTKSAKEIFKALYDLQTWGHMDGCTGVVVDKIIKAKNGLALVKKSQHLFDPLMGSIRNLFYSKNPEPANFLLQLGYSTDLIKFKNDYIDVTGEHNSFEGIILQPCFLNRGILYNKEKNVIEIHNGGQ
ncbi:MAG: hypothetical protein ACM31H_06435 [Nitrososphaerales archaeon]